LKLDAIFWLIIIHAAVTEAKTSTKLKEDGNSGTDGEVTLNCVVARSVRYWLKYDGNTLYGSGSVWSVM